MIELKELEFGYKKGKPIFRDLHLSMAPGYIYGLLGRNGAGKSTLLKQMSGLLFPKKGECLVFGHKASDRHPAMLEDLYLIPEEFYLPEISLASYVQRNAVFYSKFDHDAFLKNLSEFELPQEVKLSTLSYGQKKKFLISFGLATNCRLLILDEPTNGLDIPSKSQFRRIMAAALTPERLIVISTHQVRDLENLIDTVVVVEKGSVIFHQNMGEISEKISFEQDLSGVPEADILYSEEIAGKKVGLTRNQTGLETRVDLEILFNGIVQHPSALNAPFSPIKTK
jgi:ABC-2 type transport system ATP-binding protein